MELIPKFQLPEPYWLFSIKNVKMKYMLTGIKEKN